MERLGECPFGFIRGDEANLCHALQDIFLAVFGDGEVLGGGKAAGRLGQTGQHGALGQGQFGGVLVKIGARGRLDPVSAGPEVNLVEIEIQNLVLAQGVVDAISKDGFLQFADVGLFRGKEERLDHLLGDGTSALDNLPRLKVLERCSNDPRQIDPAVFIETHIFGSQKSFHHMRRNLLQGHQVASFRIEFANQRPIRRIDTGNQGRVVVFEGLDAGQGAVQLNVENRQCQARYHPGADE